MLIRQVPTDFLVDEILGISLSESGEFRIYRLRKRNMDTLKCINYLAKKFQIPQKQIGYAGLKDTHAITTQYISIPIIHPKIILNEQNLQVICMGYATQPVKLGSLEGNRFEITVRDLEKTQIEDIKQKAQSLVVPNYYDSQRFGSFLGGNFIAAHTLSGNYERAVKTYLTTIRKSDSPQVKEEKHFIKEHWDEINKLAENSIHNDLARRILEKYKKTNDWQATFEAIPKNLRDLFNDAFMSYFWNECVKEIIAHRMDPQDLIEVKYSLGTLTFFKKIPQNLPDTFQIGEDPISTKILGHNGLNFKEVAQLHPISRNLFVTPKDFCLEEPLVDDRNSNDDKARLKITVKFTLPKGSYATIIIKHLFGQLN